MFKTTIIIALMTIKIINSQFVFVNQTNQDRNAIIKYIDEVRGNLTPTPTQMPRMKYSLDLEEASKKQVEMFKTHVSYTYNNFTKNYPGNHNTFIRQVKQKYGIDQCNTKDYDQIYKDFQEEYKLSKLPKEYEKEDRQMFGDLRDGIKLMRGMLDPDVTEEQIQQVTSKFDSFDQQSNLVFLYAKGFKDINQAIFNWFSESLLFTYGQQNNNSSNFRNYITLVNDNNEYIGCAQAKHETDFLYDIRVCTVSTEIIYEDRPYRIDNMQKYDKCDKYKKNHLNLWEDPNYSYKLPEIPE